MTRSVSVALLPELAGRLDWTGAVGVAIDVLRATTTIAHALVAGARAVVPCETVEAARIEAQRRRDRGAAVVTGGERGGVRIPGFDLDNSPSAYVPATVRDKVLVFTTTNGTRALAACAAAERTVCAAFSNLGAVLDALAADARPVRLVCAGTDGFVTLEDCLCAGALVAGLERAGTARGVPIEPDDAARLCLDFHVLHGQNRDALRAALRSSRGGANLLSLGFDADVERAAERDCCPVVPDRDRATGELRIAAPPIA